MKTIDRRTLIKSASVVAASLSLPIWTVTKAKNEAEKSNSGYEKLDYIITARETRFDLGEQENLLGQGFNGQFPAPVIRCQQGQRLRVKLVNHLKKSTTIHWHGVRIENKMDGVPFLTQDPVQPGEEFIYDFIPPDAGTFWYHPHINSVEQLSKGLTGILIVEEREPPKFDLDQLIQLKNWNINSEGEIGKLFNMRKAARSGTIGRLMTVNGKTKQSILCAPGELIRLRFANLDNSKIYRIFGFGPLNGQILAVDSNPLISPWSQNEYELGPGSRIDVGLQIPLTAKGTYQIIHNGGSHRPTIVEIFISSKSKSKRRKLAPLPKNPVPVPNLNTAKTLRFKFEWSGAMTPLDSGNGAPSFWSINRIAWQGFVDGKKPEPLAVLERNQSYIFEFSNETPHRHPIHLHGLFFRVDWSNKKTNMRPYFADTVLLDKYEKVRVSLVADNPGNWMFHCHIIEHLKTGFMGYITVT